MEKISYLPMIFIIIGGIAFALCSFFICRKKFNNDRNQFKYGLIIQLIFGTIIPTLINPVLMATSSFLVILFCIVYPRLFLEYARKRDGFSDISVF